jgi:hypothetical protein
MLNPVIARASLEAKVTLTVWAAPTATATLSEDAVAITMSCVPPRTVGLLKPGAAVEPALPLEVEAATEVVPKLLL